MESSRSIECRETFANPTQGDLVMIHGAVHHMSKENTSPKSRHTFQVHLVEDTSGSRVGIDGMVSLMLQAGLDPQSFHRAC